MKKLLVVFALGGLLIGCGEEKKEEKKEGFEMNRTKKEDKAVEAKSDAVPVDMDDEGVGPFKDISFDGDIDQEMASAGKEKFNTICTACHMIDQRMIGPALKGFTNAETQLG